MIKLDIALEFSTAPGARLRSEGEHSAEEFRERLLAPRLRNVLANWQTLHVILDGTAGYAACFLEEAFGGLIRNEGFTKSELDIGMKLVSEEEPELIAEINGFIADAQAAQEKENAN
jgi:hypothetical protein